MSAPSLAPSRKVTAGGIGGAVSILIVWAVGLLGVDVPAEAASAITTVVGSLLAYLVPDREPDDLSDATHI